jgi:hypothetical protein
MHTHWAMTGLSLLMLAPTTGCSSFNRDWKAAGNWDAPSPAMAGAWAGTWNSAANGHNGSLRAILTPLDETTVEARFKARFWGILSYQYSLQLQIEPNAPGEWSFAGSSDLGWLAGGVFECQGVGTADELKADYHSKRDHGTFSLSRPTIEPSP